MSVQVEQVSEGVQLVRLSRPDKLNALDTDTIEQLHVCFDRIGQDQATRVVVLTGAGRAFCSGLDLSAVGSIGSRHPDDHDAVPRTMRFQQRLGSLVEKIHRCPTPVVAAVNGLALGGGFALSLASDIRIVSTEARFGAIFIKVGASNCDIGTSYLLPRLVGASRSAELLLTGRQFDAEEARDMGLVVDVVAGEELLKCAIAKAEAIAEHGRFELWMTKETMWQNVDAPSMGYAIDMENRTQVMCTQTGKFLRAVEAFASDR